LNSFQEEKNPHCGELEKRSEFFIHHEEACQECIVWQSHRVNFVEPNPLTALSKNEKEEKIL
jgi:hypothetical protein